MELELTPLFLLSSWLFCRRITCRLLTKETLSERFAASKSRVRFLVCMEKLRASWASDSVLNRLNFLVSLPSSSLTISLTRMLRDPLVEVAPGSFQQIFFPFS
jgi:hypothetical protein